MSSPLTLYCVHCKKFFKNLENFNCHIMKYLKWFPLKCYYCTQKLSTPLAAAAHLTEQHKGRGRLTLYKDKPLSKENFYRYLIHAVILGANPQEAKNKSYQIVKEVPRKLKLICTEDGCSMTFKKIEDLVDHLVSHIDHWNPLKCPHLTCRKNYNQEEEMVNHLRRKHTFLEPNRWIVRCEEEYEELNGKLRSSLANLQQRLRRQHAEEAQDEQAHNEDIQAGAERDTLQENENSSEDAHLDPQDQNGQEEHPPTERQGERTENAQDSNEIIDVVTISDDEEEPNLPGSAVSEQVPQGTVQVKMEIQAEDAPSSQDPDVRDEETEQDNVNLESAVNEEQPERNVQMAMETSLGEVQPPRQSVEDDSENPTPIDNLPSTSSSSLEQQESPEGAKFPLYVPGDNKPPIIDTSSSNSEPMDTMEDHLDYENALILDRNRVKMENTASDGNVEENRESEIGSGELQMIPKREEQLIGNGMQPSSSNSDNPSNNNGSPHLPILPHLPKIEVNYWEIPKPVFPEGVDLSTMLQEFHSYFEKNALRSVLFNLFEGLSGKVKNPIEDEVFHRMANITYTDNGDLLEDDFSNGIEELPIPVYSLIENVSKTYRPDGFEYLKKNTFNGTTTLEKEKFQYRCDCKGFCGTRCKCWRMSVRFGKCFVYGGSIVRFLDEFKKSLVFACGPECGCSENCGNRLPAQLTKSGLELFQRDERIGTGVRTTEAILPGQIVAELTAEVLRFEEDIPEDAVNDQYSWTTYDNVKIPCKPLGHSLKNLQKLDKFPEIGRAVVLEVVKYGNVARFFTSSEWPNVLPIRVVENDLRPEAMRLLFMCSRPILPYQEILADYGKEYEHIGECLCGMPTCGDGMKVLKKKGHNEAMSLLLGIQMEMKTRLPNEERNMSAEEEDELHSKCSRAHSHNSRKSYITI